MNPIANSATTRFAAFAVVALAFPGAAGATTLYKHVDKDGRVTYSDQPSSGTPAKG